VREATGTLSQGDGNIAASTDSGMPLLLTVEQAADALNVSVRFVRRLIAERRIAVHRIGRHVRLARADLEVFAAQGRSEPTAPRGSTRHP
jgi:excisionase family DNA binding protein